MKRPSWSDVSEDWADFDGLRDIFVFDTKLEDWQRLIDLFRLQWPSIYSEDGSPERMPTEARTIFRVREQRAVRWEISASPTIHIHCHFFTPEEIEFDVDPQEVRASADFDAVCEFIGSVGAALGKTVSVCAEGDSTAEIMRYEPETDLLRRVSTAW